MVTSEPPSEKAGGAEKICWELSRVLRSRGHDVEILTSGEMSDFDPGLDKKRSKISRKLLYDYYNINNNKLIDDTLLEFDPDLVHFHNVYGIGSNLIKRASERKPTVTTVHDYWPFCFRSTMMISGRPCTMNCIRCRFPLATMTRHLRRGQLSGTYLIAPSQYMMTALRRAGFDDISLIYNGINPPSRQTDHTSSERLIYAGRLVEEKGLRVLMNAAKKIDMPIDIFGQGPMKNDLEDSLGDREGVTIHGYVQDGPDYWRGGTVVLPSIWPDNLPTTLLEALAYGLPIIASDIGGIPEIVEDGANGFLIPPGDVDGLVDRAHKMKDPSIYQRMADSSREIMRSRFTWEECVAKHETLYQNVIERFNRS